MCNSRAVHPHFIQKVLLLFGFLSFFVTSAVFAQPSDGQLSSLLNAEHYFAASVKSKGLKAAFLKVSDEETLVFRPNPVKALPLFTAMKSEPSYQLSWSPVFARIAKSGDWGFSSGPFQKLNPDGKIDYGQYVSVWRANRKGIWKLHLDLGINHAKPGTTPALDFQEPSSRRFFRQPSAKRLEEREDVVMINDRLLSATLASKGLPTYREFLSEHSRLLFPGQEPILGKQAILDFWEKAAAEVKTTPESVDRAFSGDWAYTLGSASLTINQETRTYTYVRIWELQQGFNWNLVLEVFVPLAN